MGCESKEEWERTIEKMITVSKGESAGEEESLSYYEKERVDEVVNICMIK